MKINQLSKDIFILTSLALCMAIGSYLLSGWLNDQTHNNLVWVLNTWFDGDMARVYLITADRLINEHISSSPTRHPLFSIIAYPPSQAITSILGVGPPRGLRLLISISAALWIGCIYSVMRLMGCKKFDATVFSILAASSASSIFWFAVPETFAMGSISILVSLLFIAFTRLRNINWIWYILLNIVTLSITITNWMAGLTVTYLKLPFRKFIVTLALALTGFFCFWLIQAAIFPYAHELFAHDKD